MTRDEFKAGLSELVDNLVDTDRELTEADEGSLIDNFPDVANEIFDAEDTDAEEPQTAAGQSDK